MQHFIVNSKHITLHCIHYNN